jgi:hypothetical protein
VQRASCAQSFIKGSYKSERVQWLTFLDQSVMLRKQLWRNRDAIQSWHRPPALFPKISTRRAMVRRRPASIPSDEEWQRATPPAIFSGGILAGWETPSKHRKNYTVRAAARSVRGICVDKHTRSIGCCQKSKDIDFHIVKNSGEIENPHYVRELTA